MLRPQDAREAAQGGREDSGWGFGDSKQPAERVYAPVTITPHFSGFRTSMDKAWTLKKEQRWVRDMGGGKGALEEGTWSKWHR